MKGERASMISRREIPA